MPPPRLVRAPIDTAKLVATASVPAAGAVVLFVGITREFTDQQQTLYLEYEAYAEMAEKEMASLQQEAQQRWPLTECLLVHRLGRVALSEASVAVVVSAPHRDQAFSAGRWLIDELKVRVPIWKKEHWADGSSSWVHPSGDSMEASPNG